MNLSAVSVSAPSLKSEVYLGVLAAVSLLITACGSPSKPATTTPPILVPTLPGGATAVIALTVTPAPARAPSPTPTVSSTPSPAPDQGTPPSSSTALPAQATAEVERLPAANILVPDCWTGGRSLVTEIGTAPGPTPTPWPSNIAEEQLKAYLTAYSRAASYVLDAAAVYVQATEAGWPVAKTTEERAAAIQAEATRLVLLCQATAVTPAPPTARAAAKSLETALEARVGWLRSAGFQVRCCGLDASRAQEGQRQATAAAFGRARADLAAVTGSASGASSGAPQIIVGEITPVNVQIPAGWAVVRNDVWTVLSAPVEYQKPSLSGLGPTDWSLGTALRVRRVAILKGTALETIVDRLGPLLRGFGSETARTASTLAGRQAVDLRYSAQESGWTTLVRATLAGDTGVLLFEMGCPQASAAECATLLETVAAGAVPR